MSGSRKPGRQIRIGLLTRGNLLLIALDAASEFHIWLHQPIVIHSGAAASTQKVDIRADGRAIGRVRRVCGSQPLTRRLGLKRSEAEQKNQTEGRRDRLDSFHIAIPKQ
jgi:hypothetical protein